jgi:hypothetical protein
VGVIVDVKDRVWGQAVFEQADLFRCGAGVSGSSMYRQASGVLWARLCSDKLT